VTRAVPRVPTVGELVDHCAHSRDVADFQVRRIEQQLAREGPGERREELLGDLSRYRADRDHWADYVGYYRARAAREGAGVVPFVAGPRLELVPEELEEDRRLPREREPGGDDDQ
jgi:hypothetical protein